MMKVRIILLLVFFTFPVLAFEINTHQAITRCALSNLCQTNGEGKGGAQNLNFFVLTMQLQNQSYENEIFEGYGSTYIKYAKENKGLGGNDPNDASENGKFIDFKQGSTYLKGAKNTNSGVEGIIDFESDSYISLIEAGSILEDAVYPDADLIAFGGDGRFNNHFYSAQFYYPNEGTLRHSDRALLAYGLLDAYGQRTDNISWALDDSVAFSTSPFSPRKNDYTVVDAFRYYRGSFAGSKEDRKKSQAKLFVSLGHILHLLQDVHSPAHVRNGPHAGGDYLEIFGRHNGGFFLRKGELQGDKEIKAAVAAVKPVDYGYLSYQGFFLGEAQWVSQNFFSEAHEFTIRENVEFFTGEGLELNDDSCGDKSTTIFDTSRNAKLAKTETTTVRVNDDWNYINTNGNASVQERAVAADTVVAFERRESALWPDKCRTMAAPKGFDTKTSKSYSDFNKTALKDTAKHVIPAAVASVQAFTDFFFRGRMEASLSFDDQYIIIKNVSDHTLISNKLLTFRKDPEPLLNQSFTVYYINQNQVSVELGKFPLYQDIDTTINNKYAIKIGDLLKDKNIEVGDNDKLIVLFDGQIGQDPEGTDTFNLDARGLSVAYVRKSLLKQTEQVNSYDDFDDGWYRKGAIPHSIRNPRVDYDDPDSTQDIDTVFDVVTGLQWQDNPEAKTLLKQWVSKSVWQIDESPAGELDDISGDNAFSYCTSLSLAGHSNWRLPTMHELLTLTRFSYRGAKFLPGFENVNTEVGLWSADYHNFSSAQETLIYFGTLFRSFDTTEFGNRSFYARYLAVGTSRFVMHSAPKNHLQGVRCVRNFSD